MIRPAITRTKHGTRRRRQRERSFRKREGEERRGGEGCFDRDRFVKLRSKATQELEGRRMEIADGQQQRS